RQAHDAGNIVARVSTEGDLKRPVVAFRFAGLVEVAIDVQRLDQTPEGLKTSTGVDHQRRGRYALGQFGSQQAKDAGALLLEVLPGARVDINVQVVNGGNVLLLRLCRQRSASAIDVEVDVLGFVLAKGPR